jgi:mannose-6-phosphate isomerase-like protein (cupin superfamily)
MSINCLNENTKSQKIYNTSSHSRYAIIGRVGSKPNPGQPLRRRYRLTFGEQNVDKVLLTHFPNAEWQIHPTLAGVKTKVQRNAGAFSPSDVLLASLDAAQDIPWHVHAAEAELAYFLQGSGLLMTSYDEGKTVADTLEISGGTAVMIPPGLWHMVRNVGDETLLVFASHTP